MTGIDSRYETQPFYHKDFESDRKRVDGLFEAVLASEVTSIPILQQHVSQKQLLDLLGNPSVAIVALVDARSLHCSCIVSRRSKEASGSFLGHFIVLWSYDNSVVWYSDPSSRSHRRCCIEPEELERARLEHGTDQDLLVVQRTYC